MNDRLFQSAPQAMTSNSFEPLPDVLLELRQGTGKPASFPFSHVDFLIGTVPGCDLRIPGSDMPAVLCLLARRPGGLALRKLAPTQVILVNGKTSTHADLQNGDRISIGATDIFVRLSAAAASPARPTQTAEPNNRDLLQKITQLQDERDAFAEERKQSWGELQKAQKLLEEREAKLRAQAEEFDKDRGFWLQRRQQESAADIASPDIIQREEDLSLREAELQDQLADVQRQRQELANVRQELADIRKQLYDRYQERRDRLSGLQEAVDRAARKVQERKRIVDAEEEEQRQRSSDLDQLSTRLEDENRKLDEERRSFQDFHERTRSDLAEKQTDLQTREHRLAADRLELEGMVKHYQADVLRLDRQNDALQEQDRKLRAQEADLKRQHAHLQQSSAELEQQAAELEQWRTKLTQDEKHLTQVDVDQQSRAEQLALRETSLEAQQATLAAFNNKLERQRDELQSLEERLEEQRARQEKTGANLEKDMQECAALQESLRQRGSELDALEASLREQMQRLQSDNAAFAHRVQAENAVLSKLQEELNRRRQQAEDKDISLAEQSRQLDQRQAQIRANEEAQRRQNEQLLEMEKSIADQRQRLDHDRDQFLLEQQEARQEQERIQTLFVEMRLQAESFVEQLPEIELRAGTTLERLAHAREQLRDHLSEISAYVRQCQEDTERDSHKIQEKERVLRQHQDEHRLALVSFRQQLIDWQAQVAETKRSLGHGEPPSVHDQAAASRRLQDPNLSEAPTPRLSESRPRAGLTSAPTFKTPAALSNSPSDAEVCAWYRKRFRDLAGVHPQAQAAAGTHSADAPSDTADDGDAPLIPIRRDILTLTDPADPSDRLLGDTLRRLKLIDADTLQALQVEARRQRRSLRQVLLAGSAVTLYQMSLIEAGNVEGLALGPVYLVDRLRSGGQEIVYRVFDPRRGQDVILRLLTAEAVRNSGRADEFRKGFTQALATSELSEHPHLVQTLEVLDVAGRPAVLQECLSGLPSADWPPLISVPGVYFRVLIQAVQGLQAIHAAGLVHGHVNESRILMMPDGIVKIGGLGEPAWLSEEPPATYPVSVAGDLLSLGQVVSKWCTPLGVRRGAKTKPPPDALVALVARLAGEDSAGYTSASELLKDLETIRNDIPANPEAWDRILRHVREHAAPATVYGAAS
jgi:hypothetical protein